MLSMTMASEDPQLQADRLFSKHTKRAVIAGYLRETRLLQNQKRHIEAERRTLAGEHRYQIQRAKRQTEKLRKVQLENQMNALKRRQEDLTLPMIVQEESPTPESEFGREEKHELNTSRWQHLLPRIRELGERMKREKVEQAVAFVSQNSSSESGRIGETLKTSDDSCAGKMKGEETEEGASDAELCKDFEAAIKLETVEESDEKQQENVSAENGEKQRGKDGLRKSFSGKLRKDDPAWTNTKDKSSREQNKPRIFLRNEGERLSPVKEEQNPVHISHVAAAKAKAAKLVKNKRRENVFFTAASEFMANLNSLSRLTDQKILDILSQQSQLEQQQQQQQQQRPESRSTPLIPNRASPWKLSTILGAMRRPSRQEVDAKSSFSQRRQEIISQQNIKDPLLKNFCQIPVCLPPVSEGSIFRPVERNWALEDVVFPEHNMEPVTQEEWTQLRHCRYLRGKPSK